MDKNFYTIFFASDRNNYSRSIQVSKRILFVILLFGIIVIWLAIIGAMRLFYYDQLSYDLKVLKNKTVLLQNLLSDVEFNQVMDSSTTYEKFISSYYNKYEKEYPDIAPVKGYVTRGLNINKNHFGIDIAAKYKDNIYSSGYGKVIFSGMNKDLGNTIIINHPGGFVTVYAHNDTNLVFSGDLVEKGQIVAYIGETGNSQGPHLHFEIWKNDQVLDPRGIIPEYDKKDVSIR